VPTATKQPAGKRSGAWSNLLQAPERLPNRYFCRVNVPVCSQQAASLEESVFRQKKALSDCPKAFFARFLGVSYTTYTASYTT
jgi:hypothetical protein